MRFLALVGALFAASPAFAIETVTVTASPLAATADGRSAGALDRFGAPSLIGALARELPGVSFADAQANPFQPDLVYRGFEASPLVGDAQGVAVYLDGVRFNQPFGDTVEWSLIPDAALAGATLETANPVFGLNALGGSLVLATKDGFGAAGQSAEAEGGSYGHGDLLFGWGGSDGDHAAYATAEVLHDDGWRAFSPSSLARGFASLAWRDGQSAVHLDLLAAANDLTGNGTTPVELLAARRSAIFTRPDETRNLFGLAVLRGETRWGNGLKLAGNLYLDTLMRHTQNGDASDASACDPANGYLCLDDGSLLTDPHGDPIADFLAGGAYAQLNLTRTQTAGMGGTVELSYDSGWGLRLLGGAAVDRGHTRFSASSRIGALTETRGVGGPGIEIDQADGVIAPVDVVADNTYYGFYGAAAYDPLPVLTIELSARDDIADIALEDRLGSALNGRHRYSRLDPAGGVTFRPDPAQSLYARYAEASRAPTPAEFSCADAAAPCSLTNFFVGDPALKQIVARTMEAGWRGTAGPFAWRADLWRTDTGDDILFAASSVPGRAYFRNIGSTRREGAEANGSWQSGPFDLAIAYSYTKAVFRSPVTLESPENPLADADGAIHVVPGNRLPDVPEHLVKLTVGYAPAADWMLALAARYATGVYLQGDEANLDPPTHPYFVLDANARYDWSERLRLSLTIDNLLSRKYETFGAFSPTADVPLAPVPGATDPRSLSPAPPRTFLLSLAYRA